AAQSGERRAARVPPSQALRARGGQGISRYRAGRQRCVQGESRLGSVHGARESGRRGVEEGAVAISPTAKLEEGSAAPVRTFALGLGVPTRGDANHVVERVPGSRRRLKQE